MARLSSARDRRKWSLGVAETLRRADQIDGYGLTRVVLALRVCADQLHPDDLAAWLENEAEYPIRTGK